MYTHIELNTNFELPQNFRYWVVVGFNTSSTSYEPARLVHGVTQECPLKIGQKWQNFHFSQFFCSFCFQGCVLAKWKKNILYYISMMLNKRIILCDWVGVTISAQKRHSSSLCVTTNWTIDQRRRSIRCPTSVGPTLPKNNTYSRTLYLNLASLDAVIHRKSKFNVS